MASLYPAGSTVTVRAVLLGERLDLKGFDAGQRLAANPLVVSAGEGQYVALFRYGAAVLFGVNPLQEVGVLGQLSPFVGQPYAKRETEDAKLRLAPETEEQVVSGEIVLQEASVEHLQVIADALAKSVVLAYYEASLAAVFDAVEPFAAGLRQGEGRVPRGGNLLRYVSDTLLIQHKMVGRVEVGEKPEVMWERPQLSRLFARLEDEYELAERRLALERKLELISRTVGTLLELQQNKRSLRVEWYIVALIVIELALSLYQLAARVH
ncbi:MAG TPA: RMD1 family protein [Vicinamibacteria bacterium]|nr:RMD1 family protein [Vicinamibacteria bacterium]